MVSFTSHKTSQDSKQNVPIKTNVSLDSHRNRVDEWMRRGRTFTYQFRFFYGPAENVKIQNGLHCAWKFRLFAVNILEAKWIFLYLFLSPCICQLWVLSPCMYEYYQLWGNVGRFKVTVFHCKQYAEWKIQFSHNRRQQPQVDKPARKLCVIYLLYWTKKGTSYL